MTEITNDTEVFDAMRFDVVSGDMVWTGQVGTVHARQFAERNLRSTNYLGSLARINGWMSEALSIGNCRESIRNLGHQHCNCPRSASGVQRRDCAAKVEAPGFVTLRGALGSSRSVHPRHDM